MLVALRNANGSAVIASMGLRSRHSAFHGRLIGAKIRAQTAREQAAKAAREADRAEAEAWSIRMEGFGGPAQPSPTIAQCLNGGARRVRGGGEPPQTPRGPAARR